VGPSRVENLRYRSFSVVERLEAATSTFPNFSCYVAIVIIANIIVIDVETEIEIKASYNCHSTKN
jgi:hypothetical protein